MTTLLHINQQANSVFELFYIKPTRGRKILKTIQSVVSDLHDSGNLCDKSLVIACSSSIRTYTTNEELFILFMVGKIRGYNVSQTEHNETGATL